MTAYLVKGFTTNPSLMRKAGAKNYQEYSKKILKICNNKPVSLEVFADEYKEMKKQAKEESVILQEEIRKRAHKDAQRVRDAATHAINDELERARQSLQQETVEAAVGLAMEKIKTGMVENDHKRLSTEFVSHLNQENNHG